MSQPILILGKSGAGKSYSMRSLDPETTFIVNVIGKDLPFRGAGAKYTPLKGDKGNMLESDDYDKITKCLDYISEKRTDITDIIIDDSQYLMVNEFMRKHSTAGKGNAVFALYNDIGDHFWNLIFKARWLRKDIRIYFLHHTEMSDTGDIKAKTIGKMLDEKVDIPGMFSVCLLATSDADGHYFETCNKGNSPAKSPPEMFDDERIPNDLKLVSESIHNYYKGE